MQKRIEILNKNGAQDYMTILRDPDLRPYAQEERSIQEIVDDGERDFMDFCPYDFGGSICYPSFKFTRRYDELDEFF